MSILTLTQLNVSYQKERVVKALNLSIDEGEIVALFGPSGGGKSTVLKAIAGLLGNVSGNIALRGKILLNDKFNAPAEARNIGLIFQDYALFPHLTVAQNIGFGLVNLAKVEKESRVSEMLSLIKMERYADSYPNELSGGQQQRIAIVRALACKPSLLLFDEAFSNIDPQFRFELIADIRQLLKTQNIAALFVTHNQDEAFAFCDKIAVMNEGKIEQINTAENLFHYPASRFIAEFLGDGIWLSVKVASTNCLSSALGELVYSGYRNLEKVMGKSAEVYIRPHQLALQESDNSVFIVEHERFVGEFYEALITWEGQSIKVRNAKPYLNKSVDLIVDAEVTTVFI